MNYRHLLAVSFAALALAACSGNSSSRSTGGAGPSHQGGGKVIGVSIQDLEAQFYQEMEAGMKSEGSKYGYQFIFEDANRDSARQQSQVEDFIAKRVDAVVLTPYDSQAIGTAIVEANNAKIPVFTADIANASGRGRVIAHIASNNVKGGEEAAKLMCTAIGNKGTVAILDEPEVTSVQDRGRGFKLGIAKFCPQVKIVKDLDAGGTRAKANADMSDLLQSNPTLSGVFGVNDDSALGALAALQAAGETSVKIVGYDATPEARTAIAAGEIYADVIQHPQVIGADTVDAIHAYFTGKKVPAHVDVPVGTFTQADAKAAAKASSAGK